MPALLELLAAELGKPRPLPQQVAKHLSGTYGISRDGAREFLTSELPKLEDYEVDLVLSPVFTPTLEDQAVFAAQLNRESVPEAQWPALVAALTTGPTHAQLLGEDQRPICVLLRGVLIERYVSRLRLHGTMSEELFRQIEAIEPAAERPLLKAVARRAIWNTPARVEILSTAIRNIAPEQRAEDARALLQLMETYQPADAAELLARIPHWEQVLRHEMNLAASPKAFFSHRIEEMHGGDRDQRRTQDARVDTKQRELEFLARLRSALAG